MKRSTLAFATISAFLMTSGCFSDPGGVLSTLEGAYQFTSFQWSDPLYYDGAGNVTEPFEVDGVLAAPRVAQTILPFAVFEPVRGPPPTYAPTIAVDGKGNLFVATHDHILASSDSGVTWQSVRKLVKPNYPSTTDRFETMGNSVWVDASTGRLFNTHMLAAGLLGCQIVAYSDNAGKTWTESKTNSYPTSCADTRQNWAFLQLSSAPRVFSSGHGPRAGLQLAASGPRETYYCEMEMFAGGPKCSMSEDGGDTFVRESIVSPPDVGCTRFSFGRAAGAKDNSLLLPLGMDIVLVQLLGLGGKGCAVPPRVAVTEDDGQSWQIRAYGNRSFRNQEISPSVSVGSDGTSYMSVRGPDHLAYLFRSKDNFKTWEGPWRVSPPNHTLAYHTTVIAGDAGRVALAFYGTSTVQEPGATPFDGSFGTQWHLFVTTSYNALDDVPRFATVQATPAEDLVDVGRVGAALGTFMDSGIGPDGRAYFAFIDSCNPRNGCTTDNDGAFEGSDHEVSVVVMDSGPSLKADHGPLASLGLQHRASGG